VCRCSPRHSRERDASACVRRHQAFTLAPVPRHRMHRVPVLAASSTTRQCTDAIKLKKQEFKTRWTTWRATVACPLPRPRAGARSRWRSKPPRWWQRRRRRRRRWRRRRCRRPWLSRWRSRWHRRRCSAAATIANAGSLTRGVGCAMVHRYTVSEQSGAAATTQRTVPMRRATSPSAGGSCACAAAAAA